MAIQCMRMEIIYTNFEWQLQEIWGSKFVTKSSKSTSIIALGMAFSRIKFTIFVYFFLGLFSQQFYRKICLFFFSELLVIRMFVKNSIFTLQILDKQFHFFAWPTLHKSQQTLSYMCKFTWEKDIGKRKVHNPVK